MGGAMGWVDGSNGFVMPSLTERMPAAAGGGLGKKERGFSGKEALKGRVESGWARSWRAIMERPARAKQPAPMEILEVRQRDIMREDAVDEREAVTVKEFIGGDLESV